MKISLCVKHKAGISDKTGQPYDFMGYSAKGKYLDPTLKMGEENHGIRKINASEVVNHLTSDKLETYFTVKFTKKTPFVEPSTEGIYEVEIPESKNEAGENATSIWVSQQEQYKNNPTVFITCAGLVKFTKKRDFKE